jgi:hypothetical protein
MFIQNNIGRICVCNKAGNPFNMKKLIQYSAIAILVTIVYSSCSTTQKAVSYTAGPARSKFVGTWVCNSVIYEGLINNTVQRVFDQAPPKAFTNSTWVLTNSGNGQYTLADGTMQSIFWSYYDPGNGVSPAFQFKKVYQGDKAKNVDTGYRLIIGTIDGGYMVLKTPVDLDGKTAYVVYSFTKSK